MIDCVGFDNDLPRRALVVGLDHEPAFDDVIFVPASPLQHGAQVDLGKSRSSMRFWRDRLQAARVALSANVPLR